MEQICWNAVKAGMINDPRITYDSTFKVCMRFTYKSLYGVRRNLPKVCGNCAFYTVQELKGDINNAI